MDKELAEKILEEEDLKSAELFEGYSGRFMYGAETTAVVVDTIDEAGYLCHKYNLRKDQLGLDWIVY